MSKLVRRLSIVAALAVLAAAIYFSTRLQKMKKPPERAKKVELIRDAQAWVVTNKSIGSKLAIQGRLSAYEKMDIFSEVSGKLMESSKPIKVGNYFEAGDLLLRIDDEENRLNLLSQKSSLMNAITQFMPDLKIDYPESFGHWKRYLDQFDVKASVKEFPNPVNDKEKYFISSKNIHSQFYTIKSAEKRLSKFSIYAPFSGVITESFVNPGSIIQPSQKLGTMMNNGAYELEATINLSDLNFIKKGSSVKLFSDDIEGKWNGKVVRYSDQIDPSTQTVIVFIRVYGSGLRSGMYLRGNIGTGSIDDAVELPLRVLIDNNAVYEIVDSLLVLRPVEVEKVVGSTAIVKGLTEGKVILSEKIVGAFEGMKVRPVVDGNSVQ